MKWNEEERQKNNNKQTNRWEILFIFIVVTISFLQIKISGNKNSFPSFLQRHNQGNDRLLPYRREMLQDYSEKNVPMFQDCWKGKSFCFILFHILQNAWNSSEFKTIFKKINKEKDYFEISSEKVACLFGSCNSKSFQNCKSVENAKKASFQKFQVKVHWRKTSWWNGQGSSLVNLLKDNDGIMTSSVIFNHSFNIDFNLWILVVMAKFQWSCHLISNELM